MSRKKRWQQHRHAMLCYSYLQMPPHMTTSTVDHSLQDLRQPEKALRKFNAFTMSETVRTMYNVRVYEFVVVITWCGDGTIRSLLCPRILLKGTFCSSFQLQSMTAKQIVTLTRIQKQSLRTWHAMLKHNLFVSWWHTVFSKRTATASMRSVPHAFVKKPQQSHWHRWTLVP
jgi:hypothetical protein